MSASEASSILVLYPRPADPEAFTNYYTETHLPLVDRLPGLLSYEFSTQITSPDGADADYFAFFLGKFPSRQALDYALSSPEGATVAGDVPNFATGGAILATANGPRPQSPNENAARIYLDAWNRHDVDSIIGCFGLGGVYTDPGLGDQEIEASELREYLTGLFAQVPDLHLEILTLDNSADGGVSAFWRGSGGANADHPEGRLNFLGADLIRFDAEGKISWTAALYDTATFKAQLGLVSA